MDLMTTGHLADRSWLTLAAWDGHRIDRNRSLIQTNVSDKEGGGGGGGGCVGGGETYVFLKNKFPQGKKKKWRGGKEGETGETKAETQGPVDTAARRSCIEKKNI